MGRKYSENEIKRILRRDIEASSLTEEKIQEAYDIIRADTAMEKKSNDHSEKTVSITYARKKKRWLLPVAAACVLLVSTATAVAAISGFFTKDVEQTEDTITYEFDVNYELQPYKVEVTAGYIPEGYKEIETGANYAKYCKDSNRQNGISLTVVTADYFGLSDGSLNASNVKTVETATIQGMESDLITMYYDKERMTRTFDKRIYMFNPQDGYVGILYGGNDLTMDELVKVAEKLQFVQTDEKTEKVDIEAVEKQEKLQEEYDRQEEKRRLEKLEAGVSAEQIFDVGESFIWGNDEKFEITVLETAISDSASELLPGGYGRRDVMANIINEDGTLNSYERITMKGTKYAIRHGLETEETEISREEVGQKVLTVKIQAVNFGDETYDFWAGAPELTNLLEEKDGQYPYSEPLNWQEYGLSERESAFYFDGSPYESGSSGHFFFRELAPDETFTYTLAFILDEDKIDNLYLDFGSKISTSPEFEEYYDKYVRIGQ